MRLDPTRRSLLLLLGCLLTALLFPRLLSEARVGAGALLPATAPLTAADDDHPESVWKELWAARTREVLRLRADLEARPTRISPSLGGVVFEPAPGADPVRAVSARVLHRDPSRTRESFLIDAGTERGLWPGLAVVPGTSLVGLVQTVADGGALVLRVDDTSSQVVLPVAILAADDEARVRGAGVAHGEGEGRIVVGQLAADEACVGDLVVTDHGRFGVPDGLVLGEVVLFDDADRDGQWEAVVRSLRDLDTIGSVYVFVRPRAAPGLELRGRPR